MPDPVARIRKRLQQHGADAALLTDMAHIRWASGFTGSNGVVLVSDSLKVLVTDSRYTSQAQKECPDFDRFIAPASLYECLRNFGLEDTVVAFDSERLTVASLKDITRLVPDAEFLPVPGLLNQDIAKKQQWELNRIAEAQSLTDDVFQKLIGLVKPGTTEKRIAAEIAYLHLKNGASGMSFDPIVASGPNGALPHARPGDRELKKGDPVVIDMGCVLDGYCSDMTRTITIGLARDDFRAAYATVLAAKNAAVASARSGMNARDLDAVARNIIESAGLGEYFVHSLGHGVGLRVHEWPRVSSTSEDRLVEDSVVTVEPGVYLPDNWGVRIEDLVILHPDGCDNLTSSPDSLLELTG
jgi:Xaa-Pro aminopeptidase